MDYYQYNQFNVVQQQKEDKEKAQALIDRLSKFADVRGLQEAKLLAEKIIPTKEGYTSFYAGKAKCSVVNTPESLRISIDTPEEFICYDFS